MDSQRVIGRVFPENRQLYAAKDTILYALGVGLGAEPLDPGHLRFLYEDGLVAMPTMANVLGHPGFWLKDPTYAIDWRQILHAEQRLTLNRPLAPQGEVIARHDIMGIRDNGERGAWLHQRKTLVDAASGEEVGLTVATLMLRGDGGCGDFGDVPEELAKLPDSAPDHLLEIEAAEILPLIYRLSGDLNPLHIDPAVATVAGFPRPILHGLATKGIAAYALLRTYCDLDPARLQSMALRFSRPVLPGDLIAFELWDGTDGKVRFRARVDARDQIVLDRGTAHIGASA